MQTREVSDKKKLISVILSKFVQDLFGSDFSANESHQSDKNIYEQNMYINSSIGK